ncbi:hypothetical protein [Zavarzinella formosa]|uniref:hypothetical protein n=1 Tax=Zavarzinella formosa TaxID=360055 RepID=UPI0012F7789B|nr:hypothetical protein [Zavarzinella formosa]
MPSEQLIILLVILGLVAVGYALRVVIAITTHRLALVMRPEFRQISPGEAWYGLIPVIGFIFILYTARQLAISLQKQFEAIGEQHGDDVHEIPPFRTKFIRYLVYAWLIFILLIIGVNSHPLMGPVFLVMQFFGIPLVLMSYCLIKIGGYKRRLEQHFSDTSLSQDERDFDEDIPPRQEESPPQ